MRSRSVIFLWLQVFLSWAFASDCELPSKKLSKAGDAKEEELRTFPLCTQLNQYEARLGTVVNQFCALDAAHTYSFGGFYRSSLYTGIWDDMELAKLQYDAFHKSFGRDFSFAQCLELAQYVIFRGSEDPARSLQFLEEEILAFGAWY
mgnify:CR=1 FL=1